MTMNEIRIWLVVGAVAACLGLGGCAGKKKDGAETKDVAGACECAVECAEAVMVDDGTGLSKCKSKCQKKYGAGATAEGFKRALEVMSKVREGCED